MYRVQKTGSKIYEGKWSLDRGKVSGLGKECKNARRQGSGWRRYDDNKTMGVSDTEAEETQGSNQRQLGAGLTAHGWEQSLINGGKLNWHRHRRGFQK